MPLRLRPAVRSDIEAMTTVFYAAFERDGLTPILFPRGYTPAVIAYALDDRRTKWGKNPNCRRMLVEDTDTGQVIGYSEWFVHSEKKQDPKRDEKTPALPQQPTSSPPPDCNLEKLAEVMECHTSQRQKIVGGKPYLFLSMMVTLPSYQRRGAASLSLTWGKQLAATLNLPSFLTASPDGEPVYRRNGWQEVDRIHLDVSSHYGPGQTRTHACMILPTPFPVLPPSPIPDTITIAPITSAADMPRAAEITDIAFHPDPNMNVLFPILATTKYSAPTPTMTDEYIHLLHTDPSIRYLKATDTFTGEMVAAAKWNFWHDNGANRSPWSDHPNPLANDAAVAWFFGETGKNREACMQGRPHFYMSMLMVLPDYQGRGIGKRLLEWGLEQADEMGMEVWIDATDVGLPLYKKLGWEPVAEFWTDCEKWGGTKGVFDRTTGCNRKPQARSNGGEKA